MTRLLPRNKRLRYALIALVVLAVIGAASKPNRHAKRVFPHRATTTAARPSGGASVDLNSPADVQFVAGSMPEPPSPGTQAVGSVETIGLPHALNARDHKYYRRVFKRLRLNADTGDVILGRIYKIVHYGVGPRGCNYYDGGFVVCIWNGRVAAKGRAL